MGMGNEKIKRLENLRLPTFPYYPTNQRINFLGDVQAPILETYCPNNLHRVHPTPRKFKCCKLPQYHSKAINITSVDQVKQYSTQSLQQQWPNTALLSLIRTKAVPLPTLSATLRKTHSAIIIFDCRQKSNIQEQQLTTVFSNGFSNTQIYILRSYISATQQVGPRIKEVHVCVSGRERDHKPNCLCLYFFKGKFVKYNP